VSCYFERRVVPLARSAFTASRSGYQKKGSLAVKRFGSKKEMLSWAGRIGQAYNKAFVNNWNIIRSLSASLILSVGNILPYADHRLIKVITHGDEAVGFLFGFPDVSAGFFSARRDICCRSALFDLLARDAAHQMDWRSTARGILPGASRARRQTRCSYSEMEKTIGESHFRARRI